MASTNPQNPDCPNCNKNGLAILPVRYAVVPNDVDATLPPLLGRKVTDVKLKHHKYALRILRQGFVYLYYEKHARGSHIKWEVYTVAPTGTLWKQPSPLFACYAEDPSCSLKGHNIPASVITIEKPEQCGRVWMAFSEHPWSIATFSRFEKNLAERDRRMQTFHPSKWVSDKGYPHGLDANETNVGQVLEYKNFDAYSSFVATAHVPQLSKPDGSFFINQLQKQTTHYRPYKREGQVKDVVALMKKAGENPGKKDHPPALIALWDAVGITHELAEYCREILGRVSQYMDERKLELGAIDHIEGLKKVLEKHAVDTEESFQGQILEAGQVGQNNAQRRAQAARLAEPKRSQTLEVCNIIDEWASKKLNNRLFENRLLRANELAEPARSAEIKVIRKEVNQWLAERNKNMKDQVDRARNGAWPKYKEKINQPAYELFQRNHASLMKTADRILDNRIDDLIAWLEAPSFISALTEYDSTDVKDGHAFNEKVGDVIFGMNASKKGLAKIDEWVHELKTAEDNLVWRAMALNQQKASAELDAALAEASKHKLLRTAATAINWVGYGQGTLQALADLYVKGATGPGLGIDRILATAGDRIFGALKLNGLAAYASEKIIQHVCSIRASVSPVDSLNLIAAQAEHQLQANTTLLQQLHRSGSFLPPDSPAVRSAALDEAWHKFRTSPHLADALKESRLAALVLLIEGINFSKLLAECAKNNDAKAWWSLAASGMTITSALFDVASLPVKFGVGDTSWSYKRLKLTGGLLAGAGSAVGAVFDLKDGIDFFSKGNKTIGVAAVLKGSLGAVNAGLTIASSFSNAGPIVARLTGNAARVAAVEAIGARAAAALGFRILFMSAGSWITVSVFGLQVFIWVFSEDALEEWCALSAFGTRKTSSQAYSTREQQTAELRKALKDVGVAAE